MEQRQLGRTGLQVSVLSFGCGAVGGLMTRGAPQDQERAISQALDAGITYFDTAPQYGNGTSEENLGRILQKLKPQIAVGTKVRIPESEYGRIGSFVTESMEKSLQRLGRDHVDLFQLHNRIGLESKGDVLRIEAVLGEVVPAFERLKSQGKTRYFGITALGETPQLSRAVESHLFDTAQICYNALNPSAGSRIPSHYPAQDYAELMARAHKAHLGTIGIRVLAGGALSGSEDRHPLAMPSVEPIGSSHDYASDVKRARRFQPLIEEGYADTLPELAVRFAISDPALSTTLVGMANIEQFEAALAAAEKGPLPPAALSRVKDIQQEFVGEQR
jgi:aryl-alcohol dehydrogenase-like predicted oxidoreductase